MWCTWYQWNRGQCKENHSQRRLQSEEKEKKAGPDKEKTEGETGHKINPSPEQGNEG